MSFLELINSTGYEVLFSLALANVTAQVLKTLIYAIQNGEFNFAMLVTTGGMPSSHSSSVVAMATSIGLLDGFDSLLFSLAAAFSIVVMYDSAGVRRAAGKQARVLNKMVEELFSEQHAIKEGRLKEFLGHSPFEVLVGGALGAFIAIAVRYSILTN